MIDAAVEPDAIETGKITGATVDVVDWTSFLKKGFPALQARSGCYADCTASLRRSMKRASRRPPRGQSVEALSGPVQLGY